MTGLKLPLFPVESTAVCVTTTVWLGVCVIVFFNLRFGWTLSGLVVPGYLVPLLLVKPVVVAIIYGQAIITYLIVRFLSDGWGHLPWWSSFFGRDRFFAIVLVSILVRASTDGWLLPLVGQWCNQTYGLQIDYRNDLHSYGLIAVALLANYLWKPGLWRGLGTSVVSVGLTYCIVNYLVLSFTNFSLGNLHYLYEDVSTSLLASPKAYIVVVTTAYVASWLNLRYSWDFNGILIPGLLALLWHEPAKIAVSVAEATWILVLASWVLKLPMWSRVTVEGGRKLLLFFTLTAAHRLALAHLLPLVGDFQTTDAYGFGYLLTTLMALKSHEKNIPLRLGRATIQASMMGAVLASVLGYTLSVMPTSLLFRHTRIEHSGERLTLQANDSSLWQVINAQRVRLYAMKVPGSYQPVLPDEMAWFRQGVTAALDCGAEAPSDAYRQSAELLARANYQLRLIEGRYLVLSELEPARGWGTYVLDRRASNDLLVEVPVPLEEWATLEAGLVLFQQMHGRALAIAGAERRTNDDRSSDVLLRRNTIMAAFHGLLDRQNTVQVRGYTDETLIAAEGLDPQRAQQSLDSLESSLWVKHALPPSLKLADLKRLIQFVDVRWRSLSLPNALRDATPRGYGELVLSRQDRRRLRNRLATAANGAVPLVELTNGYLNRWLRDDRLTIAHRGSNAYRPANVEELLLLDEEVLRPLLLLARNCTSVEHLTEDQAEQARSIAAMAAMFDYQLLLFHDLASDADYIILSESLPKRRYWGTFVLRAPMTSPYLIEVPRPLYEHQTHEFGVALFDHLDATALLIAGAHPFANHDGTSDPVRLANKVNAFQLARQVVLREFSHEPMLIIETRAIQAPVGSDLLIATDDGSSTPEQLPDLVKQLIAQMHADGLSTRFVDGAEGTAGYELGLTLQAASLKHSINKHMIALWLSQPLRLSYRDSSLLRSAEAQFQTVGIPTIENDLYEYLASLPVRIATKPLSSELVETLNAYRENGDILHLYHLVRDWPECRFTRLIDVATDQSFLLVQQDPGSLPSIFNVDGAQSDHRDSIATLDAAAIRRFARSRHFMLELRATP